MAEKTPEDADAAIERECREWMASPTHEPMDYRVPGLLRRLDRLEAQLKEARELLHGMLDVAEVTVDTRLCSKGILRNMNDTRAFLAATEPKP